MNEFTEAKWQRLFSDYQRKYGLAEQNYTMTDPLSMSAFMAKWKDTEMMLIKGNEQISASKVMRQILNGQKKMISQAQSEAFRQNIDKADYVGYVREGLGKINTEHASDIKQFLKDNPVLSRIWRSSELSDEMKYTLIQDAKDGVIDTGSVAYKSLMKKLEMDNLAVKDWIRKSQIDYIKKALENGRITEEEFKKRYGDFDNFSLKGEDYRAWIKKHNADLKQQLESTLGVAINDWSIYFNS